MLEFAGIRLPDSPLCLAARELVARIGPPALEHHVLRSYLYAEWIGQKRRLTYDREVLCVAAVLHDLGLTRLAPVRSRFELEGADLAREFLSTRGLDAARSDLVWEAIALHTTAEIAQRRSVEVGLCQLGVAADVRGLPEVEAEPQLVDQVLEAYPWLDMDQALLALLVGLYQKNPASSASHAVADACERFVPGFTRVNLCDVLLERARRSRTHSRS
ncbi:MAG TPA: HD domain-containing protein [Polyangiaceae bacterium]|nr:HD domain-containing protein [Polyangiaceae bacterium]